MDECLVAFKENDHAVYAALLLACLFEHPANIGKSQSNWEEYDELSQFYEKHAPLEWSVLRAISIYWTKICCFSLGKYSGLGIYHSSF